MKKVITTLLIVPALSFAGTALKTDKEKLSYAFGAQLGGLLKQQNTPIDLDALYRGIDASLNNKKLELTTAEIRAIFNELRNKQDADKQNAAAKNLKEGKEFLEQNAKRKGITKLANGVQYEVLKSGKGGQHPTKSDRVKVHYEGTLIDGTIFDSSYQRGEPIEFPLTGVIRGWTETIPLMSVGDTWKIYIPAHLAYGERGQGSIQPNATLIFKVELLGIN